ncbi:hypothetical protein UP09_27805 [Bradyrhizobium sp. LTSP885]|uniref:hypothetical protein n=1 Tax=Bradyrhizobium sp. LTSP885 TaxID=1619232 RepID=UPI0005C8D730|nr:hypothetical protein [Bradyrhizobium sp. LTSP885]KJC37066.1 hypothetical protein UP09_27805 [Bradyrhizobium sp. LTSP885]
MKRLILTSSSGTELARVGLAQSVISIWSRFIWGPLPSPQTLDAYFGARADQSPGDQWSDYSRKRDRDAVKHLRFIEHCAAFDKIELWFDPDPNDQLQLSWLLDHVRSHPETVAKLELRLVGFNLMTMLEKWSGWGEVPLVNVRPAHVEAASKVWQAYRASTPEACFDALQHDLSAFPLLRPALLDLLQELPWSGSGLGATEMRLLELIATGFMGTNMLFYLRGFRQRGVFTDKEIGTLLQGLAHGPRPAIAGLDDELRVIDPENARARLEAFRRSRLSVTEFGKAVLAREEDFSHHNPIDRWWGGTHLTNDNLWRWNPGLMKP